MRTGKPRGGFQLFQGNETCDDRNDIDGDDCTACKQYTFYECDDSQPSVCSSLATDIGTLGVGDGISETNSLLAGGGDFYEVPFSTDVQLFGTLTETTSEPDFYLYQPNGTVVYQAMAISSEAIDVTVSVGSYIIEVRAFGAVEDSFTLSPSLLNDPFQ